MGNERDYWVTEAGLQWGLMVWQYPTAFWSSSPWSSLLEFSLLLGALLTLQIKSLEISMTQNSLFIMSVLNLAKDATPA